MTVLSKSLEFLLGGEEFFLYISGARLYGFYVFDCHGNSAISCLELDASPKCHMIYRVERKTLLKPY